MKLDDKYAPADVSLWCHQHLAAFQNKSQHLLKSRSSAGVAMWRAGIENRSKPVKWNVLHIPACVFIGSSRSVSGQRPFRRFSSEELFSVLILWQKKRRRVHNSYENMEAGTELAIAARWRLALERHSEGQRNSEIVASQVWLNVRSCRVPTSFPLR